MSINTNGQPICQTAWNKISLCHRTLAAWKAVPRKAFIAAWTATGYFDRSHFPADEGLTFQQAMDTIDPTGLQRSTGIRSDQTEMVPNRPGCMMVAHS